MRTLNVRTWHVPKIVGPHITTLLPHMYSAKCLILLTAVLVHITVLQVGAQEPNWSEPEELPHQESRPIHNFAATSNENDLVLAGNTVPLPWFVNKPHYVERASYFSQASSVGLTSLLEGPMVPPPGRDTLTYSFPQVALDDNGTLHMVWMEPDPDALEEASERSRDGIHARPGEYDGIYYAHFTDTGWSRPSLIFEGLVDMIAQKPPAFFVDDNQVLHLQFDNMLSREETDVTYLRYDGESWVDRSPIVEIATYSTLERDKEGRLYLVYVAPVKDGPPDQLFIKWSDDGGETWSESHATHAGQVEKANRPRLHIDASSGTLHLLWGQQMGDSVFRAHVLHSTSSDGGRTWTEPANVGASEEGAFRHLRTALDPCGGLHAVYHTMNHDEKRGMVHYTQWQDGTWSDPEEWMPDMHHHLPALHVGPEGALHLFLSVRETHDWTIPPTPLHTARGPCSDME